MAERVFSQQVIEAAVNAADAAKAFIEIMSGNLVPMNHEVRIVPSGGTSFVVSVYDDNQLEYVNRVRVNL